MRALSRLVSRRPNSLPPFSRRCYSIATSHTTTLHTDTPPFRMAVIGAGPAGFYTAYRVMQSLPDAIIDMYESLPVPYGLVRFGVAPDHPEVKNCIEKFDEVAQSPRFNYIGNTPIGTHLSLSILKPHYDALLLSYGASKDRTLGIPGEDLPVVYSARAFVGWYNGLPEYRHLNPNLEAGSEAVIIGQGNVAMDVARVLLSDVDALRGTDMTEYALEKLSRSRVERVRMVGRRGVMQAAFAIKELRELIMLEGVGFKPLGEDVLPAKEMWKGLPRAQKRIVELLDKSGEENYEGSGKRWELMFQLSPKEFLKSSADTKLEGIKFDKTSLVEEAPGHITAHKTGETIVLPADIAFRSIGYKSEPIAGTAELGIPFDERRGIVCNIQGRVVKYDDQDESKSVPVPGIYTSGWVKRGPTGVIASTMVDAFDTGDVIVKDWIDGPRQGLGNERKGVRGWDAIKDEAVRMGGRPVSWKDYKKIEAAEQERGEKSGKPSEKFGSIEEMLAIL